MYKYEKANLLGNDGVNRSVEATRERDLAAGRSRRGSRLNPPPELPVKSGTVAGRYADGADMISLVSCQ